MSDVISRLSVELALESGNFSKAITNANKAIKNLDKDFRSATKGIENIEKSFVGLGAKIDTLNKKIEVNKQKLDAQKQSYGKLEETLEKQKNKLSEIETTLGKNSDAWNKQSELVAKNSAKLASLGADIGKTESEINQLTSELKQSESAFQQLGNKTETLDSKLSKIGEGANLAQSEFNKLGSELAQNGTYFQKLENEVNQLTNKIDTGKAKINAYKQEIATVGASLDKAKNEHNQLGSTIQKVEKELQQAKTSYGANSQEALQLKQKLFQLKDSYNILSGEIAQGEGYLRNYQTELNNTVAQVNKMEGELKKLPFDKVGTDLKGVGQTVKGVGQDLMPLTASITATGIASGKMAFDFEQGMSKVGTLVAKSGKELSDYSVNVNGSLTTAGNVIKNISKNTGISINEMTEAMYQGISAGADLDNVFGLMETSSRLAIGGFTTTETAIDGLTTAMNAFGISYTDVNKVADKFILAQNNGKLVVDELAQSMGKVAPIAQSAGVSLEELLSATASLTMAGIPANEAMTALKSAFSNIIKPSSEASKIANQLGMEFNSTALQSQGLAGFLDMVKTATGGNIDTMARLFGSTEALNAILLLTGEGANTFTNTLKEMNTVGDLTQQAFEGMKESAGSQLLDAINNLKISFISLGETLAPTIETLAQGIEKLANWFGNLSPQAQTAIVTLGGITAAIAPLLVVVGNLLILGGNLVTLFGGLGASTGILGGALATLSGVALPALIVAFTGVLSKIGKSESALSWLQDKFGSLGTVIGGVCEFISGIWNLTFDNLIAKATLALDLIAAVIDGKGGQTISGAFQNYNNKMKEISEDAWNNITLTTTRELSQQKNNVDKIGKETTNVVDKNTKNAKDKATTNTKELSNSIDKNTKEAKDKANKNTQDLAKELDTNTKKAKDNADKNTKDASKVVQDNTSKMAKDAKTNSSKLAADMDTDFKKANKSIQQESTNMYNGSKQSFSKLAEIAKQAGTDMYNGIRVSAEKMASSAKQSASNMYNGVTTSTRNMANNAIADWNRVKNAYATPITGKIQVVKTTITKTAQESTKTLFSSPIDTIQTFSNNLVGMSFSPSIDENVINGLKEQLSKTKQIEDEITKIYQKEVEKRKKLIDEELKKRLDAINKEKEAYNKSREEAKYQDNYNDQMDKIQNLEKQLEIAKKDTSLAGQKKVQDLLKQLQEEQKKLQDMVQDKIDDQVNDMFDQESDRLQSEADKAKEDLDNLLDPSNLQKVIQESLKNNIFKDLEGNVYNLQDALLKFADDYGDGLTSIGAIIKSELIENLNIALATMKNFSSILGQLGLSGFNSSGFSNRMLALDYNGARYSNNPITSNAIRNTPKASNSPINIQFNQPLCVVQGNVDNSVMPHLEKLIKKAQDDLVNSIVRELR